ncbi:MAG: hypothetical protein KAU17_14430 [Spirochaetales bacterium]|nr:hypothetical protein [Spirochaetales bacterium]
MKRVLLIILSLIAVFPLGSLEVQSGIIKIILHEDTGRFSAYVKDSSSGATYQSFLLDDDPRTTVLIMLIGNSIYRMGESSGFDQFVEQTEKGARFIWASSSLRITEEFTFLRSSPAAETDGFSITITVENISESAITVGINYLLDTYLGERVGSHFMTSGNLAINRETEYTNSAPDYWVSPSQDNTALGFLGMLRGAGITSPDRVIFANWKRLNETPWTFSVNSSRNFNYLPYSINDSSVAIYYNPQILKKGEKKRVVLAFGASSSDGFAVSSIAASTILNVPIDTSGEMGDTLKDLLRADLISVKELLYRINQKIASGVPLTEEELAAFEQALSILEQRKLHYE